MTTSTSAAVQTEHRVPRGVRLAAILAFLVGTATVIIALMVAIAPADERSAYVISAPLTLATGLGVLCGAALLWRRQRLGVLVLVLAWAVQIAHTLVNGGEPRGNVLMTATLLFAAANWKSLR